MLQIAVCDDNIDELSNMVQLIDLYRTSRHLNCEHAAFSNGFELISALEKGKRFDIYCLDIMMPAFPALMRQRKFAPLTKPHDFILHTHHLSLLWKAIR